MLRNSYVGSKEGAMQNVGGPQLACLVPAKEVKRLERIRAAAAMFFFMSDMAPEAAAYRNDRV